VVDEYRDRAVRQAIVDRVEEQGGIWRADGTGGDRCVSPLADVVHIDIMTCRNEGVA